MNYSIPWSKKTVGEYTVEAKKIERTSFGRFSVWL